MKKDENLIICINGHRDNWHNLEFYTNWFNEKRSSYYSLKEAILSDPEFAKLDRILNDEESFLILSTQVIEGDKQNYSFIADAHDIIEISWLIRNFDSVGWFGGDIEPPPIVIDLLNNRLKNEGGYKQLFENDSKKFQKYHKQLKKARKKEIVRKRTTPKSISFNVSKEQFDLYQYSKVLLGKKRYFIENILDFYDRKLTKGIDCDYELAASDIGSGYSYKRIQFHTSLYYYEKYKKILSQFKNRDHLTYNLFKEFRSLAI